jgi:hypothetical protein
MQCCILFRQNDTLARGLGLYLFEDALKLKSAVWFICLILFVAAVDTIPDPPAISPPNSRSCGISAIRVRGPLSLQEKTWVIACNLPRQGRLDSLLFRSAFDDQPVALGPLPRIHHATDSSPPVFS